MPRLIDLLRDAKLPVRVRLPTWDSTWYIEIVCLRGSEAVGFNQLGYARCFSDIHMDANPDWSLYTEPKKERQVVMYRGVWTNSTAGPFFGSRLYKTKEEIFIGLNKAIGYVEVTVTLVGE